MSDSKSCRDFVAPHIAVLPKSGIRFFFDLVNTMSDVISLGIGEPDFVSPWSVCEAAMYSLERGRTCYTSNLGLMALRQAICDYLEQEFSVRYNPQNECLVTVGVSEAFDLAIRAITSPGDEIIYHEPCYVSYGTEIKMAHGVAVPVNTLEKNLFALDPADLEKAVTPRTRAIILNFPCNPTGAVLTPEQMRDIAKIAVKYDLAVIADHIYSELHYDDEPMRTVAALPGMRERTIFLHGFSKAFAMTGFRIGYACGPNSIVDAMMKIHQYAMLCAPTTAQYAAVDALKYARPDMKRMVAEYKARRNVIVSRLNGMGLSCFNPDGAFYVFPNITSTGLSSQDFAVRLLQAKHVAVVPGSAFGACGEGYVRCSYATSLEEIRTAMDRMEEFVNELKAKKA